MSFFQIFDISLILAVNEKNRVFRWDTFKDWKLTKIDHIFFGYAAIMFLLIGIANEQIPIILKSKVKIEKKAKSALNVIESQN